jgi:FkbM family methyltransferase
VRNATIHANGRRIRLAGKHPQYLEYIDGVNADLGPIARAARDLPSGAICFDVGANIGATAIPLAVQRTDLRIFAFEPVPENASWLRQNIESNRVANVEVVEAAVGSSREPLGITDNGPWSLASPDSPLKVPAVKLDDYADMPVAFVKIDVEGFEPNVIDGARDLFERRRPLVFAEFNSWCLLLQGYNPIAFSRAIYRSCEVLGVYREDSSPAELPGSDVSIAYQNLVQHNCITDVLWRPRLPFPSFREMVEMVHN